MIFDLNLIGALREFISESEKLRDGSVILLFRPLEVNLEREERKRREGGGRRGNTWCEMREGLVKRGEDGEGDEI